MSKILIVLVAMTLAAAIILSGCNNSRDLEAENAALAQENTALQTELDTSESDLETARQKTAELEEDINDIFGGSESQLRNPTWAELRRFVETDKTDTLEYIPNEFDCEGFTITLRDHAWRRGFRSGYVAIGLGENVTGHALNAFQTTDKGLVYIDNSEHDTIGYIQIGRVYGTIALDGIKETYIDCNMPPDQFWKPLAYSHYTGNLFSYDYYENYASRYEFYSRSIIAYNAEVSSYNSAFNAFKQGDDSHSYSELEAWNDQLESWSVNMDKLVQDLGSVRIEPMGTVRTVEVYWN